MIINNTTQWKVALSAILNLQGWENFASAFMGHKNGLPKMGWFLEIHSLCWRQFLLERMATMYRRSQTLPGNGITKQNKLENFESEKS